MVIVLLSSLTWGGRDVWAPLVEEPGRLLLPLRVDDMGNHSRACRIEHIEGSNV